MSMATRLRWYLGRNGVHYDCVEHAHSSSSLESARRANVAGNRVAKSVLLEDEQGYVNAILPADHYVDLKELREQLNRELEFASEAEIGDIFFDCELGAIPALSKPYGVPTVVDRSLLDLGDVYIESGDHETLVHISGRDFARLTCDSTRAHFSAAV